MCNVHYNGKGSNLTDDEALTILRRGGWGNDDGPGGDWGDCAFADCDDATRAEYRSHAVDLLAEEDERRFRTERVGPGDLTVEDLFGDDDIAGMMRHGDGACLLSRGRR